MFAFLRPKQVYVRGKEARNFITSFAQKADRIPDRRILDILVSQSYINSLCLWWAVSVERALFVYEPNSLGRQERMRKVRVVERIRGYERSEQDA